jgi:host factor-I protein
MPGRQLQQAFLDEVVEDQVPVLLHLIRGVKLSGVITGYDAFALVLAGRGSVQLVQKRAVATIDPARSLDLRTEDESPILGRQLR